MGVRNRYGESNRASAPIEYTPSTAEPSEWRRLPTGLLAAIEELVGSGQAFVDQSWASYFACPPGADLQSAVHGWATDGARVEVFTASRTAGRSWAVDLERLHNDRGASVDVRRSILPPPSAAEGRHKAGGDKTSTLNVDQSSFHEILSQLPIRSQDELLFAVPPSDVISESAETWLSWGPSARQLVLFDRRSRVTTFGLYAERTSGSRTSNGLEALNALRSEPWAVTRLRIRLDR